MDRNVAAVSAVMDKIGDAPSARPALQTPAEAHLAKEEAADLRLVIEIDEASGVYVYKTIDRVSGEVVVQFPREELLKLHQNPDYAAGDLIRAKA